MTDAALTALADRAGTPALRKALRAALEYRKALRLLGVDPEKLDRTVDA